MRAGVSQSLGELARKTAFVLVPNAVAVLRIPCHRIAQLKVRVRFEQPAQYLSRGSGKRYIHRAHDVRVDVQHSGVARMKKRLDTAHAIMLPNF